MTFETALSDLLGRVPGSRGAVFCDETGESVAAVGASGREAPGESNDFDLRVAGAQVATPLGLAFSQSREQLGSVRELTLRSTHETLLVHALPDGYYVVLCLAPQALVPRAWVALRRAALALAREI